MQKPLKERIDKLAEKYKVSPNKIVEIESTIWEFVREEMGKGDDYIEDTYENILLKYLGTFHFKPNMLRRLKLRRDGKQD